MRDESFERDKYPGKTPIDAHLNHVIVAVPATVRGVDAPDTSQALVDAFAPNLAAITGWPLAEVPALYGRMATQGLPLPGSIVRRSFGDLVYASFAETIKSPDRYPEARQAFVIALSGIGIDLAQQTLEVLRGEDDKLDRLLDAMAQVPREGGLNAWLQDVDAEWRARWQG